MVLFSMFWFCFESHTTQRTGTGRSRVTNDVMILLFVQRQTLKTLPGTFKNGSRENFIGKIEAVAFSLSLAKAFLLTFNIPVPCPRDTLRAL
jgi:hypothetical protein